MDPAITTQLVQAFVEGFEPPFTGSVSDWARENIELPPAYAIPGPVHIESSPYLIDLFKDLQNPKVRQVNAISATQTGKSLFAELAIPYWIANDPGPIMRIHQNDDLAASFTETRLIPMLRNCKAVKPLLNLHRFTAKKKGIVLPHMSVKIVGASENYAHGSTIRYLLLDEAHLYEPGLIEKFLARTTAFAGRRKIIISSTPNQAGTDLEKYYNLGFVYQWQWCCPHCKQYQPWYWTKQRDDGSYAGINWDTVLNADGETTNIALSARTAWLECFHCKHQIPDNHQNRRMLNDTGKYVCIKSDGDPEVRSYTWPGFVNINLTFESFVVQYLNAKRIKDRTGLKEDLITFKNQVLGEFYRQEQTLDQSKIMRGDYSAEESLDKEWVKILTVDCQRNGLVKYYVVRAWSKKGNESRRIDYGICRSFSEIDAVAKKHGIPYPCVGVDSGDGPTTAEVYQECVKHGQVLRLPNGNLEYICWLALKGDGQHLSWQHGGSKGVKKYYSEQGKGDPLFPADSKYKGINAKTYLWSNFSIKTILANLRDGKVPGVKWFVDKKDAEYELQMYSEGLKEVVDKKTGIITTRWVQQGNDNHWFDCEGMNLAMAMMAGCFSAGEVNEDELVKIIPKEKSS